MNMAMHQETPVFSSTYDDSSDYDNDTATGGGCGCFRRFCFGQRDEDESHSSLLHEKEEGGAPQEESWFVAKLKNLREYSEVVAGPKWKNLIRKMGKICNPRKQNKTAAHIHQYSPESYALNFAGGADHEEDGQLLHSFSTRFAPGFFVNDHQRKPAAL